MCGSYPNINHSIRKGTKLSYLYFVTRSYPFLKEIHNLFYLKINGKWVKYISDDLGYYLTPRALAYWFCDDGAYAKPGLYLHTKGFTFGDVYKLAGMLHYNFKLNVTVQRHENRPVIYIRANSVALFKTLVNPYMHPSMTY